MEAVEAAREEAEEVVVQALLGVEAGKGTTIGTGVMEALGANRTARRRTIQDASGDWTDSRMYVEVNQLRRINGVV